SRTLALWPSMALLHWLGRSRPTRPIENPQPFKVHVVATSLPTDDHEMLLTLVYAEIEQRRKRRRRLPSSRPTQRRNTVARNIRPGVWKSSSGSMPRAILQHWLFRQSLDRCAAGEKGTEEADGLKYDPLAAAPLVPPSAGGCLGAFRRAERCTSPGPGRSTS